MIHRQTTPVHSITRTVLGFVASCTLILTGCPWQSYVQKHSGLPPVAFQGTPTLEQLMSAVNTTQLVKQLQSQGARLSIAGAPTLKAQMIVEQPRKFRLTAGLFDFTATEVDFGSNDQLAWLWVKPVSYTHLTLPTKA